MEAFTVILTLLSLAVVLLMAGVLYQFLGRRRDRKRFPPMGQLIKINDHSLHVLAEGSGSPTVIFESALAGSSLSWCLVQPEIAKFTRTCSYDRVGFGWSDAGPMPRTISRAADELQLLLRIANISPPYVFVGHSYGGLIVREFAERNTADVAGMVLIDPAHPEIWGHCTEEQKRRLELGAKLAHRGEMAARIGVARLVSLLVRAGTWSLARYMTALTSGGRLNRSSEEILAPVSKIPKPLRPILSSFWVRPEFFAALASQMETLVASCEEFSLRHLGQAGVYGKTPVYVISSASLRQEELERQESLAGLSAQGRHIHATGTGHWVQLDDPALVIAVVKEMIYKIRTQAQQSA